VLDRHLVTVALLIACITAMAPVPCAGLRACESRPVAAAHIIASPAWPINLDLVAETGAEAGNDQQPIASDAAPSRVSPIAVPARQLTLPGGSSTHHRFQSTVLRL
jgi:hypothetical protein